MFRCLISFGAESRRRGPGCGGDAAQVTVSLRSGELADDGRRYRIGLVGLPRFPVVAM